MKIKQRNTYVTLCGKVGMFCWLRTYHVHDIYIYIYIYDTFAVAYRDV